MSNKMSSILVNEIDILDGEILLLITKEIPLPTQFGLQ